MAGQGHANYYVSRQDDILAGLAKDAARWRDVLAAREGDAFATAVLAAAHSALIDLLPAIPYIGGDENHLTGSLLDYPLPRAREVAVGGDPLEHEPADPDHRRHAARVPRVVQAKRLAAQALRAARGAGLEHHAARAAQVVVV